MIRDSFYPDCATLRTEPLIVEHRRYVLDGSDWPLCGAELLDTYDHDRPLVTLLAVLQPGQVGVYSTADGEATIERVW